MSWKKIKELLIGYNLIGLKALLALLVALSQIPQIIFAYFIIDVIQVFYQKYKDDEDSDLSKESIEKVINTTKKTQEDLDKVAKEQKEYYTDLKTKQVSLSLLNKLLTESLIREKDLLSFTSTSSYYQVFVYSASLTRLAKNLGIDTPNRLYPIFLEGLGFARLGQNSQSFLINKNNLKEDKLTNIKEFKNFLNYHFSKLRKEEWKSFLEKVEVVNNAKYLKLKEKGYKELGALKVNFLLTETNMNITNIGYVDDDRMGLGKVSKNEDINQQILEGAELKNPHLNKELKVKIKKIIDKQDISLLLDGITKKDRNMIDAKQDSIRKKLNVGSVIEFSKVNVDDLSKELQSLNFSKKKSKDISIKIVSQAIAYKQALDELRINI